MPEHTITASDLHVKTLEYLVDLWDKGLLPQDMKEYVMEEVPILKLLESNRKKEQLSLSAVSAAQQMVVQE